MIPLRGIHGSMDWSNHHLAIVLMSSAFAISENSTWLPWLNNAGQYIVKPNLREFICTKASKVSKLKEQTTSFFKSNVPGSFSWQWPWLGAIKCKEERKRFKHNIKKCRPVLLVNGFFWPSQWRRSRLWPELCAKTLSQVHAHHHHHHHLAGNISKSLSRLWFSPQLKRIKCWSSASVLTHSWTAGFYRCASDGNCVATGSIIEWPAKQHAIEMDALIISPLCVFRWMLVWSSINLQGLRHTLGAAFLLWFFSWRSWRRLLVLLIWTQRGPCYYQSIMQL